MNKIRGARFNPMPSPADSSLWYGGVRSPDNPACKMRNLAALYDLTSLYHCFSNVSAIEKHQVRILAIRYKKDRGTENETGECDDADRYH